MDAGQKNAALLVVQAAKQGTSASTTGEQAGRCTDTLATGKQPQGHSQTHIRAVSTHNTPASNQAGVQLQASNQASRRACGRQSEQQAHFVSTGALVPTAMTVTAAASVPSSSTYSQTRRTGSKPAQKCTKGSRVCRQSGLPHDDSSHSGGLGAKLIHLRRWGQGWLAGWACWLAGHACLRSTLHLRSHVQPQALHRSLRLHAMVSRCDGAGRDCLLRTSSQQT